VAEEGRMSLSERRKGRARSGHDKSITWEFLAAPKKIIENSLVSAATGEPTKIRGYFWWSNKTVENNFSFDGYCQNRLKFFEPPKNDRFAVM
jgi:hypothetical protein